MIALRHKTTPTRQWLSSSPPALLAILFSFASWSLQAAEQAPKAVWYRYYDSQGVANLSTSVTPAHIRHGYDALDSNMQVIKRSPSYNSEADIRQSSKRAAQAKQQAEDIKLKKAYSNVKVAEFKRNDALQGIRKQINFQQQQLKQLQSDRSFFKQQEAGYLGQGKTVPATLKQQLDSNAGNILRGQQSIKRLQADYQRTEKHYQQIIERLNNLE